MIRLTIILTCGLLVSHPLTAQVISYPPADAEQERCDRAPVWPSNVSFTYRMANTRPGGQTGSFTLVYNPHHALEESPVDHVYYKGRYLSAGVSVYEQYSDMGNWVMRDNFGKNRWKAQCWKKSNDVLWLQPIDIYGNLSQVEVEDCDYRFYDDGETTDCDGGGGGSSSGGGSQWEHLCFEENLDPGCYDVYVDDVYSGTICC